MKLLFTYTKQSGFTLFFATLVAALSLAIGLAIYDLTSRELILSATATQSQYAIFAADSGADCALYWDSKYGSLINTDTDGSAFAAPNDMSLSGVAIGGQGVVCNSEDLFANNAVTGYVIALPQVTATQATSTFEISVGSTLVAPCALVTVSKDAVTKFTTVTSHGYNTCNPNAPDRLERTLQVIY
jgi:predicted aconitase with swiveling domain